MSKEQILHLNPKDEEAEPLEKALRANGYKTFLAKDVDEGLRLFKKHMPRLVLLDTKTPESMSFLLKLKEHEENDPEIILISRKNDPSCPDIGVFRSLKRPFGPEDLICSVQEAENKIELKDERDRYLLELKDYSDGLERMVRERTAELTSVMERLRTLSITDDLTGLYNRRFFFQRLGEEISLSLRHGHPLSVMIIDIDNFKVINDTRGHIAGDTLLKEFAEFLWGVVRKSDIVARYGGEEFGIILPHTDGKGSLKSAEKIRKKIGLNDFPAPEGLLKITVSIGAAEFDKGETDPDVLLRWADTAMYTAKRAGKNICSLWSG